MHKESQNNEFLSRNSDLIIYKCKFVSHNSDFIIGNCDFISCNSEKQKPELRVVN